MAVGYRATLTLPASSDATALVEEQLHGWIRQKRDRSPSVFATAEWDGPGLHELGPGAELVVVHDDTLADSTRRRYRLREANSGEMWGVTISVLDVMPVAGRSDTIVIEAELEGVSTAEALRRVSTPRVVEYILDVTAASNGRTRLNGSPEIIGPARVSEALEAISDETRSSGVIVAASIDAERDQNFMRAVASLTRQSLGLTTTFLVSDSAVQAFNAALPASHRIPRGAVRTFAPSVNLRSTEDGRRHPLVTAAMLAAAFRQGRVDEALQRRHAWAIRARGLTEALPRDVRRGLDLLGRHELEVRRAAEIARRTATSAPLPVEHIHDEAARPRDEKIETRSSTEPQHQGSSGVADASPSRWPARLSSLTLTWLGREDQTDEAIEHLHEYIKQQVNAQDVAVEQLEDAAERSAGLEEQIESLQQRLEVLELDAAVDAERAREAERLVRAYQGRIRGEHPAADLAVEPPSADWAVPGTVAELVLRLAPEATPIARRVVFTGDADLAASIDIRDQTGRLAGHFWDFSTVLFDFAELKSRGEFTGSVHGYLTSPSPAGRRCATERHVDREEAAASGKQELETRVIPVPRSVSLSGQVSVATYFRPSHSDAGAPRMYYYDDVRRSGRIYVGYIGPWSREAD